MYEIREMNDSEMESIFRIINEAAMAYKRVIPEDRWKEPYMPMEELRKEIESGVRFYGYYTGRVVAVAGIQDVLDKTLIRHVYVLPEFQRKGIGGKLVKHLVDLAENDEVLVGTWEAAWWAIKFYEKYGFRLVSKEEKDFMLRKYWDIPERQVETSVVLKFEK